MKRKHIYKTIMLALVILISAFPVAADDGRDPVGDRIRVRNASIEFASGAPFYISHGWIQVSDDGAIGVFGFSLDLDGVTVPNFYRDFSTISGDPDILNRIWVYTFPVGLSGEHTFTGHWYAPCQYALDELGYEGICANPNQQVETTTRILTIHFIP